MAEETESYRISRWCKSYIANNVMALFHSISLAVVFLPRDIGRRILSLTDVKKTRREIILELGEETVDLLFQEEFIVLDEYNDMDYLIKTRNQLMDEISLEMMYLLLTDCCNLRCRYCFEDTPSIPSSFKEILMSKNTAYKALKFFAKLTTKYGKADKQKIIHLYGGEPLLNSTVVRDVILNIEVLKQEGIMPLNCEVVIITNGTLLTEDLAQFFAENNVNVGISIDGPKHINNIYRVAKNNEIDVFEKVKFTFELLRKHKVKTGLSVTLTPEAIKSFDQVLDYFIKDFGACDGINFNILHFNPGVPTDLQYFELAAQCLIKAFKRFREVGIYEERMMRKAHTFINREPIFADCGVIGNQIVVAPDGQIGVCQDFVKPRQYFKGSVYDDDYDPIVSGLFSEWRKRSPFFMKKCFDCEALGICGGGCPASVELKTGSRWNIDERICSHSKLSLEWLIWDAYSQLNLKEDKQNGKILG